MVKREKFFYGWWIVFVAFLSIGITYGTKGIFSVIQLPMLNDLHWTRSEISGAFSANMLIYAVIAPFVGKYMDKVGIKTVLVLGSLLTGVAFMLCSIVTQVWQFVLFFGAILGLANTGMGMIPGPTAVNRFFIKKRGRALSIALVASPGGAVAFSMLAKHILPDMGWRTLFVIMAISSWVLVTLPAFFLMKSSPEEIGIHPDGEEVLPAATKNTKATTAPSADQEDSWTLSELVANLKSWTVFLPYFIIGGAGWTVQAHMVPHLIQMGIPKADVIDGFTAYMFLGIFSMLFFPSISDYIKRKNALAIALIIQALGVYILSIAHTVSLMWTFVVIMGIAAMGSYGIISALAADIFGRKNLGTVAGTMAMIASFGAAFGIYAGGWVFDTFNQNYSILWSMWLTGLIIATGVSFMAGPIQKKQVHIDTATVAK